MEAVEYVTALDHRLGPLHSMFETMWPSHDMEVRYRASFEVLMAKLDHGWTRRSSKHLVGHP